jgi:hypothetical protein
MPDGGAASIPLIVAALGSSAIGGLTAPEGQELQSFDNAGASSPKSLLSQNHGLLEDYLGALLDDAEQPVTMRTTVNPLPSYVGGGLPMAISAPGMDANRLNPDLRTTPGFSMSRRRVDGTGRVAVPREEEFVGNSARGTGRAGARRLSPASSFVDGDRMPGPGDLTEMPMGDSPDDAARAQASLRLLGFV